LRLFFGGEAVVADATYFGAGDGDEELAVPGDLVFKLVVEVAFEFADLAAAQTGHVNVIARAMGFVIVAITAQMQQVEFVDEAVFFEQIDGAVDSDEMHVLVQFLGALEDLIDVEMLFGVVHDLEDDAALAREADAAVAKGLLEMAGGLDGIDAFAGRDAMGWRSSHEFCVDLGGWAAWLIYNTRGGYCRVGWKDCNAESAPDG
jgi:hypothetical protein